MSDDDRLREFQRDLQSFAMEFKVEIARRQAENGAVRDVLNDTRDAFDRLVDDMQRVLDRSHATNLIVQHLQTDLENLKALVNRWKDEGDGIHELLHRRISETQDLARREAAKAVGEARDAAKQARKDSMDTEERVHRFIERWLPKIVVGIVVMLLISLGIIAARGGIA